MTEDLSDDLDVRECNSTAPLAFGWSRDKIYSNRGVPVPGVSRS